jgi:peptidoglycan/LPS O-acetylase OafA/YrhL
VGRGGFVLCLKRLLDHRHSPGYGCQAALLSELHYSTNTTHLSTLLPVFSAVYGSGQTEWRGTLDCLAKLGWSRLVLFLSRQSSRGLVGALPPIFSFAPLWSLQVEEQFYLLYPLVVLLFSRPNLARFLLSCVLIAPAIRSCLLLFVPGSLTACYVLMPCRMDALALGGLVAIMMRVPPVRLPCYATVRLSAIITGSVALGTYSLWWFGDGSFKLLMPSIGYTLVDIAFAALLTLIVLGPSSRLSKSLRWEPLVYTGKIAYGLYLLHGPVSWGARKLVASWMGIDVPGHSALSVPITFLASFAAAGLSWRFFESPLLALKDRFTIQ